MIQLNIYSSDEIICFSKFAHFHSFHCRIGIIEKKLEDVMYETRGWEEKNKKLVDRVSKLFMVVSVADPAWRIEGLCP